MKVSGENTSVAATAAATAAANKSEALEAAKKEAVNQALENKGVIDIKVKQMEDAKVVADQTVTKALTAQTNTKSLVDTAQIQKKAADKEVEDAVAVVQNATVALNDANDVGDTDEITSSQNAKNAAEDSLVSYQDSQTNAQTALDTAKSEKNAADTNVRSAITKQTEVGSNLVKVKVEQTNASDAIKTLTE